jgi:hypothetical protein
MQQWARGGTRQGGLHLLCLGVLKLGQLLFRHGGELDSLWFIGHPLVFVLAAYVVHMDLVLAHGSGSINVDVPDYSLPVSPARTDITHSPTQNVIGLLLPRAAIILLLEALGARAFFLPCQHAIFFSS